MDGWIDICIGRYKCIDKQTNIKIDILQDDKTERVDLRTHETNREPNCNHFRFTCIFDLPFAYLISIILVNTKRKILFLFPRRVAADASASEKNGVENVNFYL